MRTVWWLVCVVCLWSGVLTERLAAQGMLHHELQVSLQPAHHTLQVTDTITVPLAQPPEQPLVLHAGLRPVVLTPGVQLIRQPDPPGRVTTPLLASYMLTLPRDVRTFTVRYQGVVHHPLSAQATEYRLGMRETPGLIDPDGVYLSAATAWYPQFEAALLTFRLDVEVPSGWEAISQGGRSRHVRTATGTSVRWESPVAQEQIVLLGGPLHEYSRATDTLQAMVFLRTPEAALAQTYLDATEAYVRLYQQLLGPYLYPKFAVVENVWESGLGLPSLTLMGSKVLRLPFMVHAAYPHEILHNWWGNGVFVDAQEGNWAEGLTAYLADHLLQEQRGSGAIYRRNLLQKYTDYVATADDLPLTAFRARHSAATEAIGYGKALMLFHMLRQQLGDRRFLQALRALYRDHAFQRVTFGTLQRVFTTVTGENLQPVFQQWVHQPGAPTLHIGSATVHAVGPEYHVQLRLEQTQPGPGYHLRVPVAVSLHGVAPAVETVIEMGQKHTESTVRVPAPPRRLDVDPAFDVWRRLHQEEIPPAFSQLLGAERALLVLPQQATPAMGQAYHQLAQVWTQTLSTAIDIRWDHEITSLPSTAMVWLFGWENRFLPEVRRALAVYGVVVDPADVRLHSGHLGRAQHTLALAMRHPDNPQRTLAWVAAPTAAALPGLGRKLPHYGTSSFLGFTGEEPVNVLQGQWPVLRSPLSVQFRSFDERTPLEPPATLQARPALAPAP